MAFSCRRGSALAVALLGSVVVSGTADGASLGDAATRVADAWAHAGGQVTRRDSRFVMEDEVTTLDLRPDGSGRSAACRRIALIGSRGMSFHVTAASGGDSSLRVPSAAGVVELEGCDGGVPDFVRLKSDSGRGALETVIVAGDGPSVPAFSVLLERTGGVLPSPPEAGPLPPLSPPGARANLTEERLAREGSAIHPQTTWTTGDDGRGGGDLVLEEGCHRFDLFAVEPRTRDTGRHAHLDLDGSLRTTEGELLAEDVSVAPDVRLETCVGGPTMVRGAFEGAARGSPVLVTHAFRAFPPHVPRTFGPAVRARLASVLIEHRVPPPRQDPVWLAEGAAGPTPVAVELEPGACYVVVAALERTRGRGHGIAIHAILGERVSEDEHAAKDDAAIVAFCAGDARFGRLDIDTRSSALGWAAAMYRMAAGAWSPNP